MNSSTLQDTRLITDLLQLKLTAEELVRQEIVGVDTESNSLYAYFERVCLIQFSTTEVDLLIDPLGLDDLSALKPVLIAQICGWLNRLKKSARNVRFEPSVNLKLFARVASTLLMAGKRNSFRLVFPYWPSSGRRKAPGFSQTY